MSDKLDELMYCSGMTAQGCWDEMDSYQQNAINLLVKYVAKECMSVIVQNRNFASQHKWPATELANVCLYEIDKLFGVQENGKETVSG
jgi:hypothetical protein